GAQTSVDRRAVLEPRNGKDVGNQRAYRKPRRGTVAVAGKPVLLGKEAGDFERVATVTADQPSRRGTDVLGRDGVLRPGVRVAMGHFRSWPPAGRTGLHTICKSRAEQ